MEMYILGIKWEVVSHGHYKTMSVEEIRLMGNKIKKIAAEDSMLFMWATFPNLRESLSVIES